MEFEQIFMMYLPRICEHCLNPPCVPPALRAQCTSGMKTVSYWSTRMRAAVGVFA